LPVVDNLRENGDSSRFFLPLAFACPHALLRKAKQWGAIKLAPAIFLPAFGLPSVFSVNIVKSVTRSEA
jgi:hypothetical protein